jgi:hypothetical protein
VLVARKLRKRKAVETHALFIFEVEAWDVEYSFSVNGLRDREGPYSEIVLIHVETVCRYPEKLVGRPARFDLYAERGIFEPWEWKQDSRLAAPEHRLSPTAALERQRLCAPST